MNRFSSTSTGQSATYFCHLNTKHSTSKSSRFFMELHHQQLLKHCRVCGRRLCKAKGRAQPINECTQQKEDLHILGVDVSSGEDEQVLPQHFCNPCHAMLGRAKKASEEGVPYQATTLMEWTPHQPDCEVNKGTESTQINYHTYTTNITDLSTF